MIDLSKHYDTLTAPERLKLSIEAMARGDWDEAAALGETCPKIAYKPQRDLAFTGKYHDLQSMTLLHAAFFWKQRGAMHVAWLLNNFMPSSENKETYRRRRTDLIAMIAGWTRFCEYAGFDPDAVLLSFGLVLEVGLDDEQDADIEPDEVEIEANYQMHLRSWK